jgi:hypothetical protein
MEAHPAQLIRSLLMLLCAGTKLTKQTVTAP